MMLLVCNSLKDEMMDIGFDALSMLSMSNGLWLFVIVESINKVLNSILVANLLLLLLIERESVIQVYDAYGFYTSNM